MNLDFLVVGFYHVPKNMATVFVLTLAIAEPLLANFALDNTPGIMDSAINTRK